MIVTNRLKTARLWALTLLTLATALAQPAAAQSPHEGWYQVEVIVYSRPLDTSAETWPSDLTLRYPLNWQELRDPEQELEKRRREINALQASPSTTSFSDDMPANLEPQAPREPEPIDLARAGFYELPRDSRGLNQVAARLQAQPGFEILFHEAWRQNVVGESQAPWVLIKGGEAYGDHFELEGSININVSRYLHVFTNLWFSEFQMNTGQIRNQWPNLPQNPLQRLQASSEEAAGMDMTSFWQSEKQTGSDNALQDFLDAPYLPRQIVKLEQKRRMRSSELHYIDHPRLGMLVKILPYERPEQDANEQASRGD